MKAVFPLAVAALLVGASVQAQTTIAQWTFETSPPGGAGVTASSIGGILPDVGSGVGSGVHASASTVWNNPAGNGSAESFSANNWAVNDYFQFQVSTLGLAGISVSFDQTSSGTGPRDFNLAYSTDGSSFSTFASYTVLQNGGAPYPAWNSTTSTNVYSFSFDLSSVTALDNAAAVYFRLVDASTTSASGGTVGSGGTSRIDNFTVSAIPEPHSLGLLGGLALLILNFWRRRRTM